MKLFLKNYWKTLLFFAVAGLLGGFFTGLYLMDSYPADIQEQLINELAAAGLGQLRVDLALGVISALQAAGYGIVLGAIGIFLGKKTGLWRDEKSITRKPLILAVSVSVVGGLVMILSDLLIFGRYSEVICDSYAVKPTIPYVLGMVTYGGVIEEVMLRLFVMSLVAFILHKLIGKGRELPSASV